MKKRFWKKGLAALTGLIMAFQAIAPVPVMTALAYTEKTGSVNASVLNVRSGAGTGYSSVAKLARGTAVTVTDETTGSDGRSWYRIRFTKDGTAASGYVLSTYVRFAADYQYSADFEAQLTAQGFPESYKAGLRELHTLYPNWVFESENTGLDWNTAVQNELVLPRSLIDTNSISSWKSLADGAYNWDTSTWVGFDGSTWVAASQEILSYYMDPRNFLDEVFIFQFLSHRYDASLQTKEGLQKMVQGTFLENAVITNGSASESSSVQDSGSASSGSSPVISVGPGQSSAGSGSSSSGVVVSPGGGNGSSGTSSAVSQSPSVTLTAPQASVSPKMAARVAASVVIGAMPGSETGSDSSDTAADTDTTVAGNAGTTSSPVIQAPGSSQGGTSSVTVTPGGTSSEDSGTAQTSLSYVDIIMEAAEQSGVNPYVLASMILQEQGTDGRGRSISGTVSGYTGYYNYFNVGAYASDGMGAVERGLWYASQNDSYSRPWNTPEKSIVGGACFYGDNYVNAGQDTFYLKKYNVQGSSIYKHQYMTNVDGAADEAALFAEAYNGTLKDAALRFKIPVYSNMPETPCAKPTVSGSPNNKLKSLGVDGFTLTPTFARDTYSYNLIVDQSVTDISITANVIDSTASVSGAGTVQLTGDTTDVTVQVTAQNGSIREYQIHVVKQANGPTGSGSGAATAGTGTTSSQPGTTVIGPGGSTVSSGVVTAGSGSTAATPGASTTLTGPGGSNVTVVN